MAHYAGSAVTLPRSYTDIDYAHRESVDSNRSDGGSPQPRLVNQTIPSFLPRLVHRADGPELLTERIQAFVTGNLRHGVGLKELADFLGYSEKYSSEFFQLHMGTCFSQYLKQLRILKAKDMLAADDNVSMAHIAEVLGFSDSFAFSHFFKRMVGCSPTAFRKQQVQYAGFE